jgi:small subunit ribosomal protein S17
MKEEKRVHAVVRKGVVVSDKQDKTVIVKVDRTLRHAQYEKVITRGRKYYAHDEENQCKVGDEVTIAQARPMSKTKRWRVVPKTA